MFSELMELIKEIGFPIAMVFVCLWYIYKQDEKHTNQIQALSESLNNNTNILNSLQGFIKSIVERFDK